MREAPLRLSTQQLSPGEKAVVRHRLRGREGHTGACPFCRRPMWNERSSRSGPGGRRETIDHILPLDRGGGNDLGNLRLCCATCNEVRAQLDHCVGAMACARGAIGSRSASELIRWFIDSARLQPHQRTALGHVRNAAGHLKTLTERAMLIGIDSVDRQELSAKLEQMSLAIRTARRAILR